MEETFYIKNMVCDRCIKVLKDELQNQNISLVEVELGKVKLDIESDQQTAVFKKILTDNGFALIDTPEARITEAVKVTLIKMMEELPLQMDDKLSVVLSNKLATDYSKMSKIFSFKEEITIEKYFIKLKIEKVKELIQVNELNFTEISQLLDYNHINHLSRQFKTETGMSLTEYKNDQKKVRNSLDQII